MSQIRVQVPAEVVKRLNKLRKKMDNGVVLVLKNN